MRDDQLIELVTAREIRDSGIRDFFDLAEAILDAASVHRALARLDRPSLAVLAAIAELTAADADDTGSTDGDVPVAAISSHLAQHGARDREAHDSTVLAALQSAERLALVEAVEAAADAAIEGRWRTYYPVAEQLASWPALGMPGLAELTSEPAPAGLEPVSGTEARFIDHVAAERAFATTTAVAELVSALRADPARELAKGGIALPDSKRLAAATGVELEAVRGLAAIAQRAELIALDGSTWLATAHSFDWMLLPSNERWARLADAWLSRLPSDIRRLLSERAHATWGARLGEHLRWLYPAGGDWMRDRSAEYTTEAESLGITANAAPSTPGATLMTSGPNAAATAMASLFPAEVDRVYLQHDLSIVSPGPLEPRLDARLRTMADLESRALAVTYRVTQSSINRAMAAGETAPKVTEFLASISITGIPQPLEYLIASTAARYGTIRVGSIEGHTSDDGQGARSYVQCADAALLGAIVVDHGLSSLGLSRVGPYRAVSRFDSEIVFWSLTDARYPAAAEDSSGAIVQLERRRPTVTQPIAVEPPAVGMVRRLRLAGEPTSAENGVAWIERQLELAIRAKSGLTVSVRMPDGSLADYQLEPASVAGGRLRARDRKSDLERTLPLSSIAAVGPAAR